MPTINLGNKNKPRVPTTKKKEDLKIYNDVRWKKLREEKLRLNPICERCEANGRTTMAEQIHHIIPFSQGITPEYRERLAFDIDNTESLCIPCHQKEHKN